MSADNWAICPRCRERELKAHAALLKRIETEYGKIPAAEYLALVEASQKPIQLTKATLREDYEIGIWEGNFEITYRAECECGFAHSFQHSKKVCEAD